MIELTPEETALILRQRQARAPNVDAQRAERAWTPVKCETARRDATAMP
jgi:hypothetical protein